MRGARKGQSSMEQLILAGIGIAIVAFFFYFSLSMASDAVRVSQAKDMVQKLSNSADYIYSLSPGSSEKVSVYVPEGIVFTEITNKTIRIRISLSSGESDVFMEGKPVLIGEIPTTAGQQEVMVTHTESHKVMFGASSLSCSPLSLTKRLVQGQNATDSIMIRNIGEYNIQNISATSDGGLEDVMQFSQPASSLEPGENSAVGLTFTVPQAKKVGSYSTLITVSGDLEKNETKFGAECASIVTVVVGSSRPPDFSGPIITSIRHRPRNPSVFSQITIQATADETNAGGGFVDACELQLDGSGIWNPMTPVDGAYGDIKEVVTYTINPLPRGQHTVSVRCTDDESNLGPMRNDNFTVYLYTKEILFVKKGATPTANEQYWLNWLGNHTSGEGFAWNYDVISTAQMINGSINMSNYQIVVIADSDGGSAAAAKLIAFKNTAHYVVVLGDAMKYALATLNVSATGNGNSRTDNKMLVDTEHYVTEGYTIGTSYTVTNGSYAIYYHNSFDALKVLSITSQYRFTTGEAGFVITYGITRPDKMVANGNTFAQRIFDYALTSS